MSSKTRAVRVVLVTGTVGVGKSTVGHALAERAAQREVSAAFLDVDELSRLWPAPAGDPFRTGLILTNLRAITGNYEAAGASLLVLAWAIQDAEDLTRLEAAVGAPVMAIRLCAPAAVIDERLQQRHQGAESDGLAWHIRRAPELLAIQDHGLSGLPTVGAVGQVAEVADAVLQLLD